MSKLDALADIDAEKALLGACLISDRAIDIAISTLEPIDFRAVRHQQLFAAMAAQVKHGNGRLDPVTLAAAFDSPDALAYLHELQNNTPSTSNAAQYAEVIAGWKVRRDLVTAADQISSAQFTEPANVDVSTLIDHARDIIADIDMPQRIAAPDPDIDSFIGSVDTGYDWLIPDFLERRDRMLVTAGEGSGKSVLLRQIAVMCAAGIHPWTLAEVTPRNVLLVDLENSQRQVVRGLDGLRTTAGQRLDPQRLRVLCQPRGIDLTSRTDRRWLIERCMSNAAELLVIGPLYRMSSGVAARGDVGGEDAARKVTAALDEVRVRCNVAMLLETHAPHADGNVRNLRPFGSSVWLRWPEFGIGLRRPDPNSDNHDRYLVEHWRSPREARIWPSELHKRSGSWPWTAKMPTGTFRRGAA